MVVLVLAPELDLTADRMMLELDRRGATTFRFDTAWFPREARIGAEFRDGSWSGTLSSRRRTVRIEEISAIWFRSPGAFAMPATMSEAERRWSTTEARMGVGGVLLSLPVVWVNRPDRQADAAYKPRQLAMAALCGLEVPDTVVTNEEDAVRRFVAAGETVVKALGAPSFEDRGARHVLFTSVVGARDTDDLHGVETTAHQFSRWVPKDHEVRLFVVGERVMGAEIHADGPAARVDWRADYSQLSYAPARVPPEVENGVLRYCEAMDLRYGAFDFVVRPDGVWVFLECNAGGQYGWVEDAAGLDVTAALADVLTAESA